MSDRKFWWQVKDTTFRPKRFDILVHAIVQAWRNGEKGFAGLIPPEISCLPDWIEYGSRDHANLLMLWSFINHHGVKAHTVMPKAAELAKSHPEVFDPLRNDSFRGFPEMKRRNLVAYRDQDDRLERWIANLERIRTEYDGDARKIFLRASTGDELLSTLGSFGGFGQKIKMLCACFFQEVLWHLAADSGFDEERWLKLREINAFPTDVYAMRQFRKFDIVKSWRRDHHHAHAHSISEFVDRYCRRNPDISCLDLTQADWHIGSSICPKRPLDPKEAAIYCRGHCPAEPFCKYHVTSPEYSSKGKLGWELAVPRQRT